MKDFRIEPIKVEDEEDFQSFVQVLNEAHGLGFEVNPQWFKQVIQSEKHILLLAKHLGEVVGVFTGMKNTQDPYSMNMNLAVHPKIRRRGCAQALFDEAMKRAKRMGIQNLEAYGKLRLPGGLEFLKKQGFQTLLYSWEMEREVPRVDSIDDEKEILEIKEELSLRMVHKENYLVSDEEDYRELLLRCFEEKVPQNGLAETLKDPSLYACFLRKEGKLLGGLSLQLKESVKKAYLYDIGVMPDYRGKGYGLHLLSMILLDLSKRGYERANLLVAGENDNALRLYEKIGFKIKDEEVIFYKHL